MKLSYKDKLNLVKENTVLKDDCQKNKDYVVERWINISQTNDKTDSVRFKNEKFGPMPEKLASQNTIIKIVGAIFFVLWLILVYQFFNPSSLEDKLMFLAQHTYTAFFLLPILMVLLSVVVGFYLSALAAIIFFWVKFPKMMHRKEIREQRLKDPEKYASISVDNVRHTFVSTYTVDDVNTVLNGIDFEKTLDNFRKLDKEYGIIVKHAIINEQKAAVCYL